MSSAWLGYVTLVWTGRSPYTQAGKHARHREALAHSILPDEQAQAHCMGLLLAQLELEETTKTSYADCLKKFLVYLNRGYRFGGTIARP